MGAETALGRAAVAWLKEKGFEVYQEVELHYRADIVGVRGDDVAIIECKTTLGLDVIAQADEWRPHVHFRFVCVPYARFSRAREFALKICRERGIGILEVERGAAHKFRRCDAVRNASANTAALVARLREEHKTACEAGSQGGHWTEFRATCKALRDLVDKEPGIELKVAVDKITHHYASRRGAIQTLKERLGRGVVPGVRIDDARKLWLTVQL